MWVEIYINLWIVHTYHAKHSEESLRINSINFLLCLTCRLFGGSYMKYIYIRLDTSKPVHSRWKTTLPSSISRNPTQVVWLRNTGNLIRLSLSEPGDQPPPHSATGCQWIRFHLSSHVSRPYANSEQFLRQRVCQQNYGRKTHLT